MVGRTISHYRIVSQLGAGGMGVVYAAEDVRLGRPVALKFVPEELARDRQALDRFRMEARATSALNHGNICTVYDIGEDDGRPFIVMELMKGQTLRDRLASGPLKIHQIVDMGIQVADALDAAHGHGVVHRDIKPANIFLTDRGQAKVLDFGLAKLAPGFAGGQTTSATPTQDQLTVPGITLGTVSYMSPEQAAGDELDGRTDLFSLGVVLYECATGHRPFTGNTTAVILAAILNRAPSAPMLYNPDLPLRLQEVILNCLEKDRELRYQNAADLRADLRRVKRDLESGRSAAVPITPPLSNRALSENPESGGAAPGSGPGTARSGPSSPGQAPGSGATAPLTVRRAYALVLAAVAIVAVGAVAASYFGLPLLRQEPPSPPAAGPGAAEADSRIQGRLELARSNLQARNYRAAASYADEVLAIAPAHREAGEIRTEARAMVERFDAAIAEARRLLGRNDVSGASRALDAARNIDPIGSGLADLTAALNAAYEKQAGAVRQPVPHQPPPTSPPARSGRSDAAAPTPPVPQTAGAPASVPPQNPSVPPPPAAAAPTPAAPEPPGTPPTEAVPSSTTTPRPASPRPSSRPPASPAVPQGERHDREAPSAPAGEDDDAAIREVVATYERAIETKDLALYRSIKPNMTPADEQAIASGFRAVTSQQVDLTILSIERDGSQAAVHLARRDTIEASGRRQSAESRQTMTLARAGSGWVIVDIR